MPKTEQLDMAKGSKITMSGYSGLDLSPLPRSSKLAEYYSLIASGNERDDSVLRGYVTGKNPST